MSLVSEPTPREPDGYQSRLVKVAKSHRLVVAQLMHVGLLVLYILVALKLVVADFVGEMKPHGYWRVPLQ